MYILKCSDGSYYTGNTLNLVNRLNEHLEGVGENHTRKYAPVELVYFEEFHMISLAFKREKQIQLDQKKEGSINGF